MPYLKGYFLISKWDYILADYLPFTIKMPQMKSSLKFSETKLCNRQEPPWLDFADNLHV
jgi:hypothetical protein